MANKRLELSFGTPAIGRPAVQEQGKRASWLTESSSMPKVTMQVVGPTFLEGWRGKPSVAQTDEAVDKLFSHWGEVGQQ